MNQPRTSRIPAPLYAAAGAGDLAYESLRRLPTVVTGLTGRAASTGSGLRDGLRDGLRRDVLRERAIASFRTVNRTATGTAQTLRDRSTDLDVDKVREAAIRNAAVVLTNAQAAQERAVAAYTALVARGERVIGSGVVQAADTVNADLTATEVARVGATPATVAQAVESGPSTVVEPGTSPAVESGSSTDAEAKPARRTRSTRTAKPAAKTPAAKSAESTTGEADGGQPAARRTR